MTPFLQFSVIKGSIIVRELLWIHSKKMQQMRNFELLQQKPMYMGHELLSISSPPHKHPQSIMKLHKVLREALKEM